jgi:hypothetical protein
MRRERHTRVVELSEITLDETLQRVALLPRREDQRAGTVPFLSR